MRTLKYLREYWRSFLGFYAANFCVPGPHVAGFFALISCREAFFWKIDEITVRPASYFIVRIDISELPTHFKGFATPWMVSPQTFAVKTRSSATPASESEIFRGGGGGGPFSAPPLYCRRCLNPRSWPARPASWRLTAQLGLANSLPISKPATATQVEMVAGAPCRGLAPWGLVNQTVIEHVSGSTWGERWVGGFITDSGAGCCTLSKYGFKHAA